MGKVEENAEVLKKGFQDQLDRLAEVQAGLNQQVTMLDEMVADVTAREAAADAAGYQRGKDSIELPDPNDPQAQYTQAQMDAAVSSAKEQVEKEKQIEIDAAVQAKEEATAALDMAKLDVDSAKAEAQAAKDELAKDAEEDASAKAEAQAAFDKID